MSTHGIRITLDPNDTEIRLYRDVYSHANERRALREERHERKIESWMHAPLRRRRRWKRALALRTKAAYREGRKTPLREIHPVILAEWMHSSFYSTALVGVDGARIEDDMLEDDEDEA